MLRFVLVISVVRVCVLMRDSRLGLSSAVVVVVVVGVVVVVVLVLVLVLGLGLGLCLGFGLGLCFGLHETVLVGVCFGLRLGIDSVYNTQLRAHVNVLQLLCRVLLEKQQMQLN